MLVCYIFDLISSLMPVLIVLKLIRVSYLPQFSVASLLFVDNPVGAGYSYVDSDDVFLIFHSSLLPVCCL